MRNSDDDEDGLSVLPYRERENHHGIVKTTEFEVTETHKNGSEERENTVLEGNGLLANSSPEGSGIHVNLASNRV